MSLGTLVRPRRDLPRPTPPPAHRAQRRPRRWLGDACLALFGLGFGAVVATVIEGESIGALRAPGGVLTAGGRLFGFAGAYLMLVMVLLAARLPWLERSVGQDRLLRWHRRTAPWAFGSICAHVVFIVLGYGALSKVGPLSQLWTFITSYPDLLAAVVGFGLITMAVVSSIRFARRRLRYETWWVVHLYTYLGLALAFAHQIMTGAAFIGHPLTRAIWIAAWLGTAGIVVVFRILHPLVRNLRHQLRVEEVREEAPGVFVVICRGRRLERLAISGGQFFQWRFLVRGEWWQAHPYSLSALPKPPFLRLTVKASGDHSAALGTMRRGTRVLIEGPYGAFTRHSSRRERLALIGAGVGITPLRALLEDLPRGSDVAVLVRASSEAELVHRKEMAALVKRLGGTLHELVGNRKTVRLDGRSLLELIPDIGERDVYLCGPDAFADSVTAALNTLGVARSQIHREEFSF